MFTMNGVAKVGVIIAGVTLGWPTGAQAQASAPATSPAGIAAAQQRAEAGQQRATELARAGGWAYKTGLVAQAQRDAARYQEEADRALAEAQACPPPAPPSPAQAVSALHGCTSCATPGGFGPGDGQPGSRAPSVRCRLRLGEVELLSRHRGSRRKPRPRGWRASSQAGGWAYKTGAVARAEREVQAQATTQPTPICAGREGVNLRF